MRNMVVGVGSRALDIELTYKCPVCGGRIRFREYASFIQLYCPRCGASLVVDKRLAAAYAVSRRNRVYAWRRMLKKLYGGFVAKALRLHERGHYFL